MIEKYSEEDVVEGRVTKVVTFGAFVEILPGVEGLVHISELAQHHVENPREVVSQGQPVNVKIIEVDGERRRLSLSLKRVEDTDEVQPRADGAESVHTRPNLDLSEDVFAEGSATIEDEAPELESTYELPATTDDAPAAEADSTAAVAAPVESEPADDVSTDDVPEDAAEPAAEAADAAEPAAETAHAAPVADPEASSPEE